MTEVDPNFRSTATHQESKFEWGRKTIGLFLGPVVFVVILLVPFSSLSPAANNLAAVMCFVIVFWVTEAIPLPVTALLGPTLAVILGVTNVGEAFAPMANPLIFLFIGSFILAQGLFVHRVNERIAYTVLSWKLVGARPARILLAYGAIAAFLSAWMSNTATAAMLVPIGLSLLAFMESDNTVPRSYGTVLMLMTAYGCSLGGLATPVGTPPNLIAIGALERELGFRLTFIDWMSFAVPITLVMLAFIFVYLNAVGGVGVSEISGAQRIIEKRKKDLGPWKTGERNVVIAFGLTVTLWIVPGLLPLFLGREHHIVQTFLSSIPEAVAALVGVAVLFLLPVSRTQRSTITWKEAAQIDWGTILLFGGGLSLGSMASSTGLAEVFGLSVTGLLPTTSVATLTFAAALFTLILSETMSNSAATNIAVPIVISIAQAASVDPIAPVLAASLVASAAVVLPVSTPPNAIVYASGRVPIIRMIRYGVALDVFAVVVVPLMVLLLGPSSR